MVVMNTPEISVIVPVYKVEAYLPSCVDSILAQTFTNYELWLVDDGSPDNCGKICDEYAKKDARIHVIHKPNGGLSSARNAALDVCKGRYVSFVDSDDWVTPDFLETLYHTLTDFDADISVCGMINHYDDGHETVLYEPSQKKCVVEGSAIFDTLYQPCAPNKLYPSYMFTDVRYPVGRWYEDVTAYNKILPKIRRLAYTGKNSYYYFIRQGSITHTDYCFKSTELIEACDERAQMLDRVKQLRHANMARLHIYSNLALAYKHLNLKEPQVTARLTELQAIFARHYDALMAYPENGLKQRFRIWLLRHYPNIHAECRMLNAECRMLNAEC